MEAGANALCLVDADILAHATAFIGEETVRDEDGHVVDHNIRPFAYLIPAIEGRVQEIMDACNTTVEPWMCLTGDTNFRNDIAKRKGYKANRVSEKPYHWENVRCYIRSRYTTITSNNCEADDVMAMIATEHRKKDIPTIICTIDKDLLQVEGWHYSWETHNSPEKPLHLVDKFGHLEAHYKEGVSAKTGKPTKTFKKVTGEGFLWFMCQVLSGDPTDNIPGLPNCGGKAAYVLLHEATSEEHALEIVVSAYKEVYGEDNYEEELTEQAQLVYMIRERNEDTSLKHWSLKDATESAKD